MIPESEQLRANDFADIDGLAGWRVLADGACVHFPTDSFAQAVRLAEAISRIAGVEQHPPAVDLRASGVTVRLVTLAENFMGMTRTDAEIARAVSTVAAEMGLTADVSALQSLLVIPGAPDIRAITPFWQAALGYVPRLDSPEEDLVDPRDRSAPFWFETMEQPRADGGGAVHVSVWLPYELAQERVDAALAAGGRLVRDDFAPAWWTLADAAGNEVDISTIKMRD